jgi:hypothetical protein
MFQYETEGVVGGRDGREEVEIWGRGRVDRSPRKCIQVQHQCDLFDVCARDLQCKRMHSFAPASARLDTV